MTTILLDVASREEAGRKIFLAAEYSALKGIPVVGSVVSKLLKDPSQALDERLLSLVSGSQGVEGSVRWVEFTVPSSAIRGNEVLDSGVSGEVCVLRVEASTAKWRTTSTKRLYRLQISEQ